MSAPDEMTRGGVRYRFGAWSDGGARSHDIVVQAVDSTLTATYSQDCRPPPAAPGTGGGGAIRNAQREGGSPARGCGSAGPDGGR